MAITSTSSSAAFSRAAIAGVVGVLAVWTAVLPQSASPRFYPDDPLWTDNDRVADASKVVSVEDTNSYDFVVNTLGHPGEAAGRSCVERQHGRRSSRFELVYQSHRPQCDEHRVD